MVKNNQEKQQTGKANEAAYIQENIPLNSYHHSFKHTPFSLLPQINQFESWLRCVSVASFASFTHLGNQYTQGKSLAAF